MKTIFFTAVIVVASGLVAAQSVESLLLPDQLDSRATAARLGARIAELQAEATLQAALGNPGAAANINAVVAYIQGLQATPSSIPPAASNEVHAVSFYEGAPGAPNTATISVTRTGAPITLFLNAYDPITWTINPLPPGVQIAQIVVVSYDPQVVNGVPPGVPITFFDLNTNGTWYGQPDDLEGRLDVAAECFTRFGLLPTTFTGSYTAPATALEIGPGANEWASQWILAYAYAQVQTFCTATRANLINVFGGQVFVPLLTPPMQSFGSTTAVVATPLQVFPGPLAALGGIHQYVIDAVGQVRVLDGSTPATLLLPSLSTLPLPNIPSLTFPRGLAYDSIRNRLLVSTVGGGGQLYAFDFATLGWSVVAPLNNIGPKAMVHDAATDTIYGIDPGLFGGSNPVLRRYNATGGLTSSSTLGLRTWGWGFDNFQLYALGGNLVAIGPGKSLLNGALVVRQTFVIDPLTGNIVCAAFLTG
jgi:hypothetical protein